MKTSQEISNISFNSPDWLKGKLIQLSNQGIIDYWIFVPHKPEEEKDILANKKAHIHLMFKPSKLIQTKVLEKEFQEPDPEKPDKPLKCTEVWRPVRSFADWWLYALHDKEYLRHKGLERQYHYSIADVQYSDYDTLERMISFIDFGEIYRKELIMAAVSQGYSYSKAIAAGVFGDKPQAYATFYKALLADKLTESIAAADASRKKYETLIKEFERNGKTWKMQS